MLSRPAQISDDQVFRLLRPLPGADVEQRRSPVGAPARLLIHRETLEIDPARDAGLFLKLQLAGLPCVCLHSLLTMPVKDVLIIPCNEAGEGLADQLPPVDAEQRRGPQIGLHNRAGQVQREMAGGGKIVEVRIPVTHRFKFHLAPTKLVVLHLQLDLVYL